MSGIGSVHLQRHLAGKRLTRSQAILAKCADCLGDYQDPRSRADCGIPTCPLYGFMPYAGKGSENAPASDADEETPLAGGGAS
jgi:hypothetical protein